MMGKSAAESRFLSRRGVIGLIEAAIVPGDLFGLDPRHTYRRLARLTHPDANLGNPDDARAAAAFVKLATLWKQWQGQRNGLSRLGPIVYFGEFANLYEDERGLVKLARSPADNHRIDREAAALRRLERGRDPRYPPYAPTLLDRQLYFDLSAGAERHANVIERLDGFVTLAEVKEAHSAGLDPRDAAWMWRRLLAAIGFAHRAGVAHGAVAPEHVLIHPASHGLVLVDWCYASREPGARALDIRLASRCVTGLMGELAPLPLVNFARSCALPKFDRRSSDAWSLIRELDAVVERLYGPRGFRPFAMPA